MLQPLVQNQMFHSQIAERLFRDINMKIFQCKSERQHWQTVSCSQWSLRWVKLSTHVNNHIPKGNFVWCVRTRDGISDYQFFLTHPVQKQTLLKKELDF